MGMLYAAGYANGNYEPDKAGVAFEHRDKHGIFSYSFENKDNTNITPMLSTQDILDIHPDKEKIQYYDSKLKHIGGLTLMLYCIRWNDDGSRLLFYFGNHSVDKKRGEPKISYVFTADKDFKEIKLAVDMSFGKSGVHWSWQKDNKNLIGYGTDSSTNKFCLMESSADGKHKRMINEHDSGGHPSTSPKDNNIIVTDEFSTASIVFFDKKTGKKLDRIKSNNRYGNNIPLGRNRYRVCHHPVFNRDGTKILFNTMDGKYAKPMEVEI
jgi:Tol biopolymer transport system component